MLFFFLFKQKSAYEMRISDWSSDVCSSDLGCYDSVEGLCHHAVPPCWPRRRCRAPARHALPVAPATMALRNCFPPPRPASKEFFGTALKPLEKDRKSVV